MEELTRELAEIDDRAKELDKARSQSISSISYINERNRKRNVEQAEKAIMARIVNLRQLAGNVIHVQLNRSMVASCLHVCLKTN